MSLDQNKALARRYYDEVLTGRQRRRLDELPEHGEELDTLGALRQLGALSR